MELHQDLPPLMALRAFEAVARHLSFIKAADELSVTQSAISHQVQKLEQFLKAESIDQFCLGQLFSHPHLNHFLRIRELGFVLLTHLQEGH